MASLFSPQFVVMITFFISVENKTQEDNLPHHQGSISSVKSHYNANDCLARTSLSLHTEHIRGLKTLTIRLTSRLVFSTENKNADTTTNCGENRLAMLEAQTKRKAWIESETCLVPVEQPI